MFNSQATEITDVQEMNSHADYIKIPIQWNIMLFAATKFRGLSLSDKLSSNFGNFTAVMDASCVGYCCRPNGNVYLLLSYMSKAKVKQP